MYPNEARLRNMTYGTTIHFDLELDYFIKEEVEGEMKMIESTEIQARIAENGILIGYADEDDLRAQRQQFKPRYASHNPLVKEALDRLTGHHLPAEKI